MLNFGERLRRARERKGLTQVDVYRAIGLNNKSLSRYENGATAPDPDTLRDLIRLYDVSADYVLGLSEEMGIITKSREMPVNAGLSRLSFLSGVLKAYCFSAVYAFFSFCEQLCAPFSLSSVHLPRLRRSASAASFQKSEREYARPSSWQRSEA